MNISLKQLLLIGALNVALCSAAIIARPGKYQFTQPDGTVLTIQKIGDEHRHLTVTDDEKLLSLDNNAYCYAYVNENGEMQSTGVVAANSNIRPLAHKQYVTALDDVDFDALTPQRAMTVRKAASKTLDRDWAGRCASTFPTTGEVNVLVILVQFSDCQFKTFYTLGAHQYFSDMLNKSGFNDFGGTGSVRDYFECMSGNKLQPNFDVVGPVTLSQPYAYYGANDDSGLDKHPGEMIVEACRSVDSRVDFSKYDNNGDGCCDAIYVVYAGLSEAASEDADAVWPHSWTISDATNTTLTLDNVEISPYACSSELLTETVPDGIGTFVHEFSHVLGLPDLYDTSAGNSIYTPGVYEVMATGSYNNDSRTPPAYSAYERNALGWIELKELNSPENITLGNLSDTNQACLIRTDQENEYFLFENRQKTGWDEYIPNSGMIIWHIDYDKELWDSNTVNSERYHQHVDLVKANGNDLGFNDVILRGWTWPGTANKTSYTAYSSRVAFKDWDGNGINMPITNIVETGGRIEFSVKGGASAVTDVESAATRLSVAVDGRTLCVSTPADEVTIYTTTGQIVTTVGVSNGYVEVIVPSTGLYIVRDSANVVKTIVR